MLYFILCYVVLFLSIKRKEYRYAIVSGLTLVYFVLAGLQSAYANVAYADMLGIAQKLTLIALSVLLIYPTGKHKDEKMNLPAAVLACIACVIRFLRSLAFDWYTDRMTQPGADVPAISEEFSLCYNLLDPAIGLAILAMLFCLAWHLGRDNSKVS